MIKKVSYIFVWVSMLIAFGHQMIRHHHHHAHDIVHHEHDRDDDMDQDGHNVFSFGQLDDSYIHHQAYYLFRTPFGISFTTFLNFKMYESIIPRYPIAEDHSLSDSPPLDRYLLRGPPTC